MNRADDPQIEHGGRRVGGTNGRSVASHAAKVVKEGDPVGGVERSKEVGDGLCQFVLDVGRIDTGAGGSEALMDIAHQVVLYIGQARCVQTLCLDRIVDYLQADMADDLFGRRCAGKQSQADLPTRGIFAELVQEGVRLRLEILVGLRVEGDLDGALDLSRKHETLVSCRNLGNITCASMPADHDLSRACAKCGGWFTAVALVGIRSCKGEFVVLAGHTCRAAKCVEWRSGGAIGHQIRDGARVVINNLELENACKQEYRQTWP